MLYLCLLVAALFASVRARRDLVLENLALRHQLAVYTRSRRRPPLRLHDRRPWSLLARCWSGWRGTLVIVEPDTVVRWHRSAWRAYWRWRSHRGSGRPRIPAELQQLIVRMATENPRWGAVRIVGELRALGFEVNARTVSRYRQQALRRPPSQSWRTFLRNHAPRIWAADLFTVRTASLAVTSSARAVRQRSWRPRVCANRCRADGPDSSKGSSSTQMKQDPISVRVLLVVRQAREAPSRRPTLAQASECRRRPKWTLSARRGRAHNRLSV